MKDTDQKPLSTEDLGNGYTLKRVINKDGIPYSVIVDKTGCEWNSVPTAEESDLKRYWEFIVLHKLTVKAGSGKTPVVASNPGEGTHYKLVLQQTWGCDKKAVFYYNVKSFTYTDERTMNIVCSRFDHLSKTWDNVDFREVITDYDVIALLKVRKIEKIDSLNLRDERRLGL